MFFFLYTIQMYGIQDGAKQILPFLPKVNSVSGVIANTLPTPKPFWTPPQKKLNDFSRRGKEKQARLCDR